MSTDEAASQDVADAGDAPAILRLGHIEMSVTSLSEARAFYVDLLGFVEDGTQGGRLWLRGVEDFERRTLTLVEAEKPGIREVGFRVASPADLSALHARHCELGLPVTRLDAGVDTGRGEILAVTCADRFPIAFFHDAELVSLYGPDGDARPQQRASHRFVGIPPLSINHVNLRVPDVDASLRYWRDALGFSVSEYVVADDGLFAAWTRRRPTTHDVALVRGDAAGLHHFAFLAAEPMAVVRVADLLADADLRHLIEFGPGRHGVTNAFFIYVRDPSGNRLEIYANDYWKDLDRPALRWTREQYEQCGRLWWGAEPPASFFEVSQVTRSWPQ